MASREHLDKHNRDGDSSRVTELSISGMTCGNCVRHVTQALQSVPGVSSVAVTLETTRATARWSSDQAAEPAALLQAVRDAGYQAKVLQGPSNEHDRGLHARSWRLNLWIGLIATAALMAGEWIFGFGPMRWYQWLSFGLATVVQFVAGAKFYRGAWLQLKVGSSNMDTLVALGSSTAYGYSVCALFSDHSAHLYFMEAAAIITLISVGHWLEARASLRASSALRSLLHLAPAIARRRNADGTETEVPVSVLQVNDTVVLKPGDKVPTDGIVEEGESAVDESMLTGESVPLDKRPKDRLYAGTVNLNGRLLMRVTAVGEQTALAHIIEAVQRAQNSRANIQRLGDKVSSVFVPIVVLIALLTGLWWGLAPEQAHGINQRLAAFLWPAHPPAVGFAAAFITAAAVLIIACPCAMGLATPAAIMAGSNAAAARGILIRDAVALEKAGAITAVIFDKTGTLTIGKPVVAKFEGLHDGAHRTVDESRIAAALAQHSSHPISQAVAALGSDSFEVTQWQEIRGAGVEGKLRLPDAQLHEVALGSLKWMRDRGVENLSESRPFVEEWAPQGATVLGLAIDRSLRGLIAIKDELKPGAQEIIERLQRDGLRIYLVTGDNPRTAAHIASQVGIPTENVFAEVRPEQKSDFVRKLQLEGQRVAFVGDGINDAPALEQADLGIAVSRASDIAREAADMILLKSEIEAVPESLGLARATLRTIKQNLFWAFFYNAAGIPLAALGFMSPVLCAAAMGLSDLVVIGNALRLRRWKFRR